jgi:hypothetical protein
LRLAELRSRPLYLGAEAILTEARSDPSLTNHQLAIVVQDFYAHVLDEENRLRLRLVPIPAEVRLKRAAYYKERSSASCMSRTPT